MQSTERVFSSSSSRWLCRDTWRCRTPTSVTYFILGRKHCWPGWAPSSPHYSLPRPPPSLTASPYRLRGQPTMQVVPSRTKEPPPLLRGNQAWWKGWQGWAAEWTELRGLGSDLPHLPLGINCPIITYLRPSESRC